MFVDLIIILLIIKFLVLKLLYIKRRRKIMSNELNKDLQSLLIGLYKLLKKSNILDDDIELVRINKGTVLTQKEPQKSTITAKTLSVQEAMEYTGFSRKQIMNFITNKSLPYINVGLGQDIPRYRFSIKNLDKLLDSINKWM